MAKFIGADLKSDNWGEYSSDRPCFSKTLANEIY